MSEQQRTICDQVFQAVLYDRWTGRKLSASFLGPSTPGKLLRVSPCDG